jgi:hypothetical protein
VARVNIENYVLIKWTDIVTYGDTAPLSVAKDAKCADCQSIGFLINDDSDKVIIAHSIQDLPGNAELTVSEYTTIPKGCIKEILILTP